MTPWLAVHETFQARILEWVAISFFRGSSLPRNQAWSCFHNSCLAGEFFYHWATYIYSCVRYKLTSICLSLYTHTHTHTHTYTYIHTHIYIFKIYVSPRRMWTYLMLVTSEELILVINIFSYCFHFFFCYSILP